jgi:asparagine synthase (glutamine-hydrolysing)
MSAQFGTWNFNGSGVTADYIEKVRATLAPYGPDTDEYYSSDGINILYRGFHTTKESHAEVQPHICRSGTVLTWDGRLDNGADLISELNASLAAHSADVVVVAAAFEKWGVDCLGKLIGDWALSVWNPRDRFVLLAKDPIGTKHLYYSFDDKRLAWSTLLDPLVLFAGRAFKICEEYIAGWLTIPVFPSPHLTPYVDIHAVPPSSSVLFRSGKHGITRSITRYWDFDPHKQIRYRTDGEYEEHFRSVFAVAVRRRLRGDRPILAELSGGMDSSSIVCMADTVISRDALDCPPLDTISWYDDSYDHIEPDTNELHWISKVENKRNKLGFHIDIGALRQTAEKTLRPPQSLENDFTIDSFAVTPSLNHRHHEFFKLYKADVESKGYRVTLSGIGGDEATGGGIPAPRQELQDLLAQGRFILLARQLNAWATRMRKPKLSILAGGEDKRPCGAWKLIRGPRWSGR